MACGYSEMGRYVSYITQTCHFFGHSVKSVQIQSFFWSVFSCIFGLKTGKYGPGKTPYLDTFHAVGILRISGIENLQHWIFSSFLDVFLMFLEYSKDSGGMSNLLHMFL